MYSNGVEVMGVERGHMLGSLEKREGNIHVLFWIYKRRDVCLYIDTYMYLYMRETYRL